MLGNWLLKKCLTNAQKNGMLRAAYRLSTGKRKKPAEAGLILNLTIVRLDLERIALDTTRLDQFDQFKLPCFCCVIEELRLTLVCFP